MGIWVFGLPGLEACLVAKGSLPMLSPFLGLPFLLTFVEGTTWNIFKRQIRDFSLQLLLTTVELCCNDFEILSSSSHEERAAYQEVLPWKETYKTSLLSQKDRVKCYLFLFLWTSRRISRFCCLIHVTSCWQIYVAGFSLTTRNRRCLSIRQLIDFHSEGEY